jgi:plasmid stabilization system protein ParE
MFKIVYRAIATEEYTDAIKWYEQRSLATAEGFINAVNEKLDIISSYPRQYKNLFRNYHEVSTNKYPFTIVYFIEDEPKIVVIISIYHHKRNPKKKYRK